MRKTWHVLLGLFLFLSASTKAAMLQSGVDCIGCVYHGFGCEDESNQNRQVCNSLAGAGLCYWEAGACRSLFKRSCQDRCTAARKKGQFCILQDYDDEKTFSRMLANTLRLGCRKPLLIEERHGLQPDHRHTVFQLQMVEALQLSDRHKTSVGIHWNSCADGQMGADGWQKSLSVVLKKIEAQRWRSDVQIQLNQAVAFMTSDPADVSGLPFVLSFRESGNGVRFLPCTAVKDTLCHPRAAGQRGYCAYSQGALGCVECGERWRIAPLNRCGGWDRLKAASFRLE